jgi:hypothetical protein
MFVTSAGAAEVPVPGIQDLLQTVDDDLSSVAMPIIAQNRGQTTGSWLSAPRTLRGAATAAHS